jgi:hypothetical protein
MAYEFDQIYYPWRGSFTNYINSVLPASFFDKKTMYEAGCGTANNGAYFQSLGAVVTSADANPANLNRAQIEHPELTFLTQNHNVDVLPKSYDIVLHWGVLPYLDSIETHLADVCAKSKYIILESIVADSSDSTYIIRDVRDPEAYCSLVGSRPSQQYIEKILSDNGFSFQLAKDAALDCGSYKYSWDIAETGEWSNVNNGDLYRRLWICWKKTLPSPLSSVSAPASAPTPAPAEEAAPAPAPVPAPAPAPAPVPSDPTVAPADPASADSETV